MARTRNVDDFLKAAADERTVRDGFWPKVARVAGKLPFAEDLLAAYYCAFGDASSSQQKPRTTEERCDCASAPMGY